MQKLPLAINIAYILSYLQLTFDAKRRFKNKNMNELFQDLPNRVTELVNASTLEVSEEFS